MRAEQLQEYREVLVRYTMVHLRNAAAAVPARALPRRLRTVMSVAREAREGCAAA